MTASEIRALSAAMRKGLEQLREDVSRVAFGLSDAAVQKELQGLRGFLGDAIQDHIEGGLDSIAERREEDDRANEFYDRADIEYERRRDMKMENANA